MDPNRHPLLSGDLDQEEMDHFLEALQDAQGEEWLDEEDEEDEDDMDFEPEEEIDEDDEEDEFDDAQENIELEIEIPSEAGTAAATGNDDTDRGVRTLFMNRDELLRLLGHRGVAQFFGAALLRRGSDSDNEAGTGYDDVRPRRRRPTGPRGQAAFEKVPSDRGKELMEMGIFGANERREDSIAKKKRLAVQIMRRELGLGSSGRQKNADRLMLQGLIPETKADMIIHYNARCYSGQFSKDGNFFFSCAQDFKVRMYDTSNPYDWKYYKTVDYPYGQWTITDASLSPDNRFLAYSSIRSTICLASTEPTDDSGPQLLDFTNSRLGAGRRGGFASYPYFGIWSLRFSGDGREIVAGAGDSSVYVYDIERDQSILRIQGHQDDVNAVCYGDANSPHILYSGSDDTTIKIWDRRSLGNGREAGVFFGHTEGLTYVDSKGDGRYVLSNGKDQTAKLWDLRKMMTREQSEKVDPQAYTTGFEYRNMPYDTSHYQPHPHDTSLVTFRGHSVLKTLIRCHFSPPGSTDSRYVYSGSYDGSVYIYNMDATLAGKVNVLEATKNSRPRDPDVVSETYDFIGRNGGNWQTCVRDASWHPDAPVIAATSWNGWGTCLGTCSVHSWNDGVEVDEGDKEVEGRQPGYAKRLNARLVEDPELYRSSSNFRGVDRRRMPTRLPSHMGVSDTDEEDEDNDWWNRVDV